MVVEVTTEEVLQEDSQVEDFQVEEEVPLVVEEVQEAFKYISGGTL